MLDTRLTDEQVSLRKTVEEFAREVVAPVAAHHDGSQLTALAAAEDGSWIERRSGADPEALADELLAAQAAHAG